MIFIDQRYPVLDEDVQHVQERHVRCAVREAEELGSNETMDKDVISHLPQMLDCNRSREGGEPEIGSWRKGWEEISPCPFLPDRAAEEVPEDIPIATRVLGAL